MEHEQKDSRYDWIYWTALVGSFVAIGAMLAWRG